MFRRTKAWVIMIWARGGVKTVRVQPVINISTMRMLDFQILRADISSKIFWSENILNFYFFSGESALPHKHLVVSSPTGFSVGIYFMEFDSKWWNMRTVENNLSPAWCSTLIWAPVKCFYGPILNPIYTLSYPLRAINIYRALPKKQNSYKYLDCLFWSEQSLAKRDL